jgi:putative membrane protein
MKKINRFKSPILQAAVFTAILFGVSSCMENKKPEDTKDVAEEHNDAKFNNNKQEKDAEFLVKAAEINLEEISLGQLAQQNGTTSHAKELGKMMEDAHTKALNDLTALAKKKNITIPTSPTDNAQADYKKLNDKSGIKFDKEYADMMVSGHKDAITVFEKASTDCSDSDIREWATAMLPDLRTHLDHAIDCQKKCEKM